MVAAREVRWRRGALLLILLATLWRAAYLAVVPLGPTPDETYYWDWSRQLAWGYYSKPPMVAWLSALVTRPLGANEVTVRLPAVLLGAVTLVALFGLTRRLFDERTGFWTVVAALTCPATALGALVMTIDAPLLSFWAIWLGLFWIALARQGAPSARAWLGAGAAAGLALLSKQMGLAAVALMLLLPAVTRAWRPHLRRPWPWLAAALALALFSPVVWWNLRHGWITLVHTAHHFEPHQRGLLRALALLGEFLGGQLLGLSPLLGVLVLGLTAVLLRHLSRLEPPVRFLLLAGPAALVVFALASLRQPINANWPAVFYLGAFPLVTAWGLGRLATGTGFDGWRRWFRPALVVAAVFTVGLYAAPWVAPPLARQVGLPDPMARGSGWRELGVATGRWLRAVPRPETTVPVALSRQWASAIALYAEGQPRVYQWPGVPPVVQSQYHLWGGPEDKEGWDCLLVVGGEQGLPPGFAERFESVELLAVETLAAAPGGKGAEVRFYLARGLRSWPS